MDDPRDRSSRPLRLDPELRRDLIVDAAERLLATQDPLTVTADQVARAAGVSRPLVHAYLGDRRAIVDAVQVRVVARLGRWVDHGLGRSDTVDARLRAVVDGTFAFVAAEEDPWGVLSASGGLDHPALHRLRARWAAALSPDDDPADLRAQAAVGALLLGAGPWVARGVDPAAVTDALRGLLFGSPGSVP